MRPTAKTLLVILLVAMIVLYLARRFPAMQKGTDFADFYIAARMVRDGRGRQLYDPTEQDKYLARYSGRVGTYYIHPPFETLVYLPFALFPLSQAYLLWCSFNALLLLLVAKMLAQHLPIPWNWQILVPFSLLFVPLLLNFLQGQDALLLLFLWTAALKALGQKRPFVAGCLLACGLIKFHLALPVAIPFLFTAPRKILGGFVSVAASLLLVSLCLCGWAGIISYPRFLGSLGSYPLAGIHSQQMANLRGLFGTIFPNSNNAALGLTLAGSLLILWLVVRASMLAMRAGQATKLVFANAVLAATLVGYHLSPHDVSVLLLPLALIGHYVLTAEAVPYGLKVLLLSTSGLLFLPPLPLWLLQERVYAYACLPVLLLFALTYVEIRRAANLAV
jgi:glycosyl transferase family 87